MNHKIIALIVTVALILAFFVLPSIVRSSIPQVTYTRGSQSQQVGKIVCQGFIEAGERAELYITAPVVADQVAVQVGDFVVQGDLLCSINEIATRAIIYSPEVGADLVKEYLQSASSSAELSALMAGNSVETFSFVFQPQYHSPISGTVTEVNIADRTLYNSPAAAIVVEDLEHLNATIYVPQADILQVQVGSEALISGEGIQGELAGHVTAINPSAVRKVGNSGPEALVPVTVALDNAAGQIRPGYVVTAQLSTAAPSSGLLLPYQAVKQDDENQEYVQVLSSGYRVEKRLVTTGNETAEQTEILSGLESSDIVIIEDIAENTRVRLGEQMDGD